MAADRHPSHNSLTSLHRLEFILQHKLDALLRDALGVGFGQVQIMQSVNTPAPISQREAARKLYQTEANISRQLQLLKRKGMVSIVRNKKDRRVREISLTAKGAATCRKAEELLAEKHKEIMKLLSRDEVKAFDRAIDNLLKSI